MAIDFPGLRTESSDEIEMGAGTQIAAIEQRCRVRGTSAKHVGLRGAGASVDSSEGESWQFPGNSLDKFGGTRGGSSANEYALKAARQRKDREMSAREASRAEDAKGGTSSRRP